jgi:hypothetical protein
LAPFTNLVGDWEGDARAVTAPNESINVRQHEYVAFGAGRTVLMVRGVGRSMEAANRGEIVFEAAATIWFDGQQLRMRAHTADGLSIEPTFEVRPDTLIWGFPRPGGRVQFTIAYTDSTWHEVSHFVREGTPPFLAVEMRLRKTSK